jgi:ATP-dependent Lon protease
MIPEILRHYSLAKENIRFSDEIIKEIISTVDTEKGVRNLKRALEDIISNINLNRLLHDENRDEIVITLKDVKRYVFNKKAYHPASHIYM